MRDHRQGRRALRGVLLVLKACLVTGCIIPFNGPGDIKRDVQSATNSDLDMDFGVTVGRSGMALARWVMSKSDEEMPPLEGIKKVEVGVYHYDRAPVEGRALDSMHWPGWLPVVEIHGRAAAGHGDAIAATRSDESAAAGDAADLLILFQYDGKRLQRMLLLVEEPEEDRLMIIRISGDLDKLIEQVIAYGLEESDHPELIEPAIETYRSRDSDTSP